MDTNVNKIHNGISLLKITAMFLIVLFHTTQTIGNNGFGLSAGGDIPVGFESFAIELRYASLDVQKIVLTLLGNLGSLGNDVFFICSAWYLCDKSYKFKRVKILEMGLNSILISWSILFISFFILPSIESKFIIRSLFPNLRNVYWYVTCYSMFYLLAPYINNIIYSLSKRKHFIITALLFFVYSILGLVNRKIFYCNDLIVWVTIYFLVSYVKIHLNSNAFKVLKYFSVISLFCIIVEDLVINCFGLKILFLYDKIHYLQCNNNPFIILLSLGLFLVFMEDINNFSINRNLASLTLFIYLIHGNILVRNYYMPMLFAEIKATLGYRHIILIDFLVSLFVFIASSLIAYIYSKIFKKYISLLVEIIAKHLKRMI